MKPFTIPVVRLPITSPISEAEVTLTEPANKEQKISQDTPDFVPQADQATQRSTPDILDKIMGLSGLA